jgi:hypothetical protein
VSNTNPEIIQVAFANWSHDGVADQPVFIHVPYYQLMSSASALVIFWRAKMKVSLGEHPDGIAASPKDLLLTTLSMREALMPRKEEMRRCS